MAKIKSAKSGVEKLFDSYAEKAEGVEAMINLMYDLRIIAERRGIDIEVAVSASQEMFKDQP